jgi:acyl-CoA thioesterase-1
MKAVSYFFRLATALTFAAAAATAALAPVRAESVPPAVESAVPAVTACNAPADLIRLVNPLKRVAQRVAGGQPIKIVAIGSSSTAGAGASSPAMNYPSRLEAELKVLFPRADITVLNRGINGEESRDMVARFDRDVFAQTPDLVLWQVGSNSVLRDRPLDEANLSLRDGLKRLREAGTDVVLINPQYAPKVINKHDVDGMVDLIHVMAKETNVDLFERFAVMRYWRLTEDIPFSTFISPDELHMNDWSYGCIAKLLAHAIQEAATRTTVTATAHGRQ